MDVTPFIPEDRQVIDSYGPGRFRIANIVYECSVIVFPDRTIEWPVAGIHEISLQSFVPVIAAEPAVDVLLVGCGPQMHRLELELQRELREAGIGAETMDTGAACRTYNALLAEGRHVAAAIVMLQS
jgi:uncharacterized protein